MSGPHLSATGRVAGKVVVVTGGARGIGRAVAIRLAREGASVVVADRRDDGAEVAETIRADGGAAVFQRHDVTQEQSWLDLLRAVRARYGGLDGLVNSAGIALRKPVGELELAEWNAVMSVNAAGAFLGMKHCAAVIAERGGGSIVNLSSVAGVLAVPSYTAYSASKAAVLAMTGVVAMEYARRGVRVNAVLPGNTDTDMARYDAEYTGVSSEQFTEALKQVYPLGRMAEPDQDVAPVVLFLLSDDARYITGAQLAVDGGLTAGTVNG